MAEHLFFLLISLLKADCFYHELPEPLGAGRLHIFPRLLILEDLLPGGEKLKKYHFLIYKDQLQFSKESERIFRETCVLLILLQAEIMNTGTITFTV